MHLPTAPITPHLRFTGNTERFTFFDFSHPFNTIQLSDYLTNRPQYVRLWDCVSDVVASSTGNPHCTVLSSFIFWKLEYSKVIKDFVNLCELNHPHINTSKTKEGDLLQKENIPYWTGEQISNKYLVFTETINLTGLTTHKTCTRKAKVISTT